MNQHNEIRKLLSAYSGNDLEPADQLRVEEHCAGCAECRGILADLQTAQHMIRTTPEVEPPPWLAARIMARVREQHLEKRSWLQRFFFPLHIKLPLEAMVLLLVCISGYYLTRMMETELLQPTIQQEIPGTSVKETKQKAPESPPINLPPPAPAAEKHSGAETGPAAPKTVEQAAPQQVQEYLGAPSPPLPFSPHPPATKEEHVPPSAGPVPDSATSFQGSQKHKSAKRARSAAPETAGKAYDTGDHDSITSETARGGSISAPGVAMPQLKIRVNLSSPSAAPESLKEAVTRSEGSVIDTGSTQPLSLKIRIPSARIGELLEQLARLGRVVERPLPHNAGGIVEIEIDW